MAGAFPLVGTDRLAKLVPDKIPDKKLNLRNAIDYVPELQAAEASPDPLVRDTLKYAKMLEGNVCGNWVCMPIIVVTTLPTGSDSSLATRLCHSRDSGVKSNQANIPTPISTFMPCLSASVRMASIGSLAVSSITTGIQFGRIEGFTYIVIHIGSMFAYIFFIAENFLNDHHIHFQLIHGTDQLSPLIVGHLLDILIPMFSFDFAPVIDARPGTGYLLDRANIRFNHFYIFCLPIGLAFISHFEDHFILPHPVLGRYNHLNRFGLSGRDCSQQTYQVALYWNKENKNALLYETVVTIPAGKAETVKVVIPTKDRVGKNKVIFKVANEGKAYRKTKDIEVIESDIRSIQQISGAWTGIYHWSEIEGKHWNQDIKKMTDDQWRELIRSMNKLEMNMVVIQEVFRNEEYVGKHTTNVDNYVGKAFYPSKLYPGRMELTAKDPIEAILTEADKQGMNVLMGVGMFAWFDFTPESLEWHKRVAKELWGTQSVMSSRQIIVPQACTPVPRTLPSNILAYFSVSRTKGSGEASAACNSGT